MLELLTAENLIALLTLTTLEIVLGIDNIVFIAVLTARLPPEQRNRGRKVGLALAMLSRIALLLAISWIMKLTAELFTIFGHSVSGRDLILIGGGLFLLAKATHEIHQKLEGGEEKDCPKQGLVSLGNVLVQVAILDLVFSLDSVITAVGMVKSVPVMVLAIVIAIAVMMLFANPISNFIERHPTMKMLALSFLLLVGVLLVAEGIGQHIEKGYVYFAMGFSLFVEMLNLRLGKVKQAS